MTFLAFSTLGFVLLVILTAAVGGVLDLPSLGTLRTTLAERRVKLGALVVVVSPALSAALDLPKQLALASKLPVGPAAALSLIGGTFVAAAVAGCWLGMDETEDPHSRPKRSIVIAVIVLLGNGLILRYLWRW